MHKTAMNVGDFASAQKAFRSPPPLGAVNYIDANMDSVARNRLSITEQQSKKIAQLHYMLMSQKSVSSGGNLQLT